MPWQRHVVEVGLELDPATGRPAYRSVVVLLPRQNGKTTLVLTWVLDRCLLWGSPQRVAYTAQTGMDARKKLLDDFEPLIRRSPLRVAVDKVHRAQGAEGILWKTQSRIDVLASTETAGHGKTLDLGVRDELFSDADDRRAQSMLPAMITRPEAQMLTVSTMGTDSSVPLNLEVERGRALVEAGQTDGVAYFEWSAEEHLAIDDPATWRSCMPALGITITEAGVQHALSTMPESEFRRAFLNQRTKVDERVIPVAWWDAVVATEVAPAGRMAWGIDIPPSRATASIVTCDSTGRAELVERRPGTSWVVERAAELVGRYGGVLGVDGSAAAGSLVDELLRRGVLVEVFAPRRMAGACGQMFDALRDATVLVRHHPALEDAAASARKRPVADAWTWNRSSSSADVSPLVALTLAHALARLPVAGGAPIFAY